MANVLALLNPTTLLAIVAAFGVGYVGGHWEGSAGAKAACQAKAVVVANQVLTSRLETLSAVAEAHSARVEADAKADDENRKRVDATPANPARCLDRPAAGRVRAVR